jgi:hypothetical protein
MLAVVGMLVSVTLVGIGIWWSLEIQIIVALLCHDACGCRWEPSEALPPGPRPASICSMHGTVKTLSDKK